MNLLRNMMVFSVFMTLYMLLNPGIEPSVSDYKVHSQHQISIEFFGQGHAIEVQHGYKFQTARPTAAQTVTAFKSDLVQTVQILIPVLQATSASAVELLHFPDYFRTFDIIFPFHHFW